MLQRLMWSEQLTCMLTSNYELWGFIYLGKLLASIDLQSSSLVRLVNSRAGAGGGVHWAGGGGSMSHDSSRYLGQAHPDRAINSVPGTKHPPTPSPHHHNLCQGERRGAGRVKELEKFRARCYRQRLQFWLFLVFQYFWISIIFFKNYTLVVDWGRVAPMGSNPPTASGSTKVSLSKVPTSHTAPWAPQLVAAPCFTWEMG